MYVGWPCPRPDGSIGEEFSLQFDKQRQNRLLVLAPMFEEASKFRHQIYETMKLLDEAGFDVMCPDLPGCNESLEPHDTQTLAGWRACADAAARYFRATSALTFRSGAWLAPNDLPGWAFAPTKPKQVLRNLLRIQAIAQREAGVGLAADAQLEAARDEGLLVAGWSLSAELVRELDTSQTYLSGRLRSVKQEEVGGTGLWLPSENSFDAAQAESLAAIVAKEANA